MTHLLHGDEGLDGARRISESLFSGDIAQLTDSDLGQLELDGLPCTTIKDGSGIVDVLVSAGLAKSNKMAREFISNNAVQVNGEVISSNEASLSAGNAVNGQYFVLKRGKKLFHLAKLGG